MAWLLMAFSTTCGLLCFVGLMTGVISFPCGYDADNVEIHRCDGNGVLYWITMAALFTASAIAGFYSYQCFALSS